MANLFRRRRVINTCLWESGLGVSGYAKGCSVHVLPGVVWFTLNRGGARSVEGWFRPWNVSELLACGAGVS